ncbi:MAG: prepilin-type N-terminal cleavage/methylation domain-containing protein [Gammaproteobacteria bacterium]
MRVRNTLRGFTLVEMLIALVLLSMISVAMYGGLRLGSRSAEAVERGTTANEDLRVIQGFLRRQLNQIHPVIWEDDAETQLLFQGGGQALYFAAPLPMHRGIGGLYLIGLGLGGDAGHDLVLRYRLLQPVQQEFFAPHPADRQVTLIKGVSELEIRYYGRNGRIVNWFERWHNPTRLPRLLRLSLRVRGARWPELLIPVRSVVLEEEEQTIIRPPEAAESDETDEEGPLDAEGDDSIDFR